jgi:hypothetical protein
MTQEEINKKLEWVLDDAKRQYFKKNSYIKNKKMVTLSTELFDEVKSLMGDR